MDSTRRRTPALGDSASGLKEAAERSRDHSLEPTVKLRELAHGHPHSLDYGFGLSSEGALPFSTYQETGFLAAPSSPRLNWCPGADFVCYPGEGHVLQQWTSVPHPPREPSPRPDVEGDGNLLEASLQIK